MPIESHEGGIVITGEAINFARLLVLRGALRLELKGIQVSSRKASTIVRKEFGWTGKPQELLSKMEALIEKEVEKGTPHR